jgi:flagellar biosynthetic protein FliP
MNTLRWLLRSVATLAVASVLLFAGPAWAQEVVPSLGQAIEQAAAASPDEATDASVRMVLMLTALSLLPGLMLAMTPFTRFVIVFSLLRQALGLQQSPPNQILIGLSLALSMLVMQPTLQEVWDDGVEPYMEGEITSMEAYEATMAPMRAFMLRNVHRDDLATAMRLSRMPRPETLDDVPTPVVVTGFVLSELRTAFVIAVKIYVPFLVVDLVVASTLLGMGMMMLPPVVISLPFKLMVFVLMDGWGLLVTGMVAGIH